MPRNVPSADDIRRTAGEILQRPDYQLESDPTSQSLADSLLIRALRWLLEGFISLAESLSILPGVLRYPAAALLCAVLVFLIYRIVRTLARTTRLPETADAAPRTRSARTVPPEELEGLAAAAHRDGRITEAVRWLLRAALLRLELAEKRKPRPGTTNRELLRRYRATPLQPPLETLVDTIDLHWYGDRPADPEDFERCSASYEQLRQVVATQASQLKQDSPPMR
jgi:hypothetical protein